MYVDMVEDPKWIRTIFFRGSYNKPQQHRPKPNFECPIHVHVHVLVIAIKKTCMFMYMYVYVYVYLVVARRLLSAGCCNN